MDNQIKHLPKATKKNTTTRLLTTEYAIIDENGIVSATTDLKTAENAANNKKVFIIKTYELKIKQQLKKKEN